MQEITHSHSNQTITRVFSVIDGPVFPQMHVQTRRLFRVERIVIQYALNNGVWKCDNKWDVTLAGTMLRKDGTDSLTTCKGAPHPDAADWVEKRVFEHRPVGSVLLP
jgi:hypothetical protein